MFFGPLSQQGTILSRVDRQAGITVWKTVCFPFMPSLCIWKQLIGSLFSHILSSRTDRKGWGVSQRMPQTLGAHIYSVVTTQGTLSLSPQMSLQQRADGCSRPEVDYSPAPPLQDHPGPGTGGHMFLGPPVHTLQISKGWGWMFMMPAGEPTNAKALVLLL